MDFYFNSLLQLIVILEIKIQLSNNSNKYNG